MATDVDALQEIFREASLSNEGDRQALLAHPAALVFPGIDSTRGRTRVVEDADGRLVGFVTTRPAGVAVELEDLFVDPTCMRQGLGRTLIDDAVTRARGDGAARLEVTANRHALDFYRAVGFVVDHPVATEFGVGDRMHLDLR